MKKPTLFTFTLLLVFLLFLQNTFADFSLPEGAKSRLGKGRKTGSRIISEDGTRFALSSSIGLWIYDVYTGEEIALLTEYPSDFTVIASSPDGNMLASAYENVISLLDIRTGTQTARLTEHTENITTLVFSPDSKTLASASEDNTIRLWNATTGTLLLLPLSEHTGDVTCIAFSPDSQMLASGSTDKTIRLWSTTTGEHIATLEEQISFGTVTHQGHTNTVTAVTFSSDGGTLASGGADNTIRLWNISTREHETILTGHTDQVTAIAFSSDSTMLASGSADDTILLWNTSTKKHLDTLEGHEYDVKTLAFSLDGETLASGDNSNTVRLWDGNTGQHLETLSFGSEVFGNPVHAVMFSRDGLTLASGEGYVRHSGGNIVEAYGTTRLWNPLTEERLLALSTDATFAFSIIYSPDGNTLANGGIDVDGEYYKYACGCWGGLIWCTGWNIRYCWDWRVTNRKYPLQLWDTQTQKHIVNLEGHKGKVTSVVYSPNGKTLASASEDNTIRLWNPATGQHLTTFQGHSDHVNAVVFSPDGQTLASGSDDDTIRLWDPDGQVRATLSEHVNNVTSVVFSPDGKILASGSADSTIRLWNPTTGEHIATLEGHTEGVSSVAFSVDGGTLASGSWDDTIRLWNPTTGEHLATLSGHKDDVNAIAFSPDGLTLASGSSDSTILLWEIGPADSQNRLDINGDGVVNFLDLTVVASRFGQTGQNLADVNSDEVVDRKDILLVLDAMEAAAGAPSAQFTTENLKHYIDKAKQLNISDPSFQRGIAVLEELLAMLIQAEIPIKTALLSNYPNPFNPETWIPYQLSSPAEVSISIYAADGKLVRTLPLGQQSIGIYQSKNRAAYWDGKNAVGETVASGVFFYTLTAGEFTATCKMLIRK